LVDLHPRAHWLTEYYQVDLLEQNADGIWRAKLYGADWAWLRRLVLRNAGSVTVVEPTVLAQDVSEQAALALRAYDEHVRSE
jgi:proteasome accessory factor C